MRLTLPIISMVITFSSLLLKNSAGKWNTLVNFESASTQLTGQFLVGANTDWVGAEFVQSVCRGTAA
ncbi:MAG: hypothetical protein ACKOE3_10660 [Betaproteobacteria bacterium]